MIPSKYMPPSPESDTRWAILELRKAAIHLHDAGLHEESANVTALADRLAMLLMRRD